MGTKNKQTKKPKTKNPKKPKNNPPQKKPQQMHVWKRFVPRIIGCIQPVYHASIVNDTILVNKQYTS